jgi:hypothetical protein
MRRDDGEQSFGLVIARESLEGELDVAFDIPSYLRTIQQGGAWH